MLFPDDVGGGNGDLTRFVEAGAEGRAVVAAELDDRDVALLRVLHPPHRQCEWRCDADWLDGDEDVLESGLPALFVTVTD